MSCFKKEYYMTRAIKITENTLKWLKGEKKQLKLPKICRTEEELILRGDLDPRTKSESSESESDEPNEEHIEEKKSNNNQIILTNWNEQQQQQSVNQPQQWIQRDWSRNHSEQKVEEHQENTSSEDKTSFRRRVNEVMNGNSNETMRLQSEINQEENSNQKFKNIDLVLNSQPNWFPLTDAHGISVNSQLGTQNEIEQMCRLNVENLGISFDSVNGILDQSGGQMVDDGIKNKVFNVATNYLTVSDLVAINKLSPLESDRENYFTPYNDLLTKLRIKQIELKKQKMEELLSEKRYLADQYQHHCSTSSLNLKISFLVEAKTILYGIIKYNKNIYDQIPELRRQISNIRIRRFEKRESTTEYQQKSVCNLISQIQIDLITMLNQNIIQVSYLGKPTYLLQQQEHEDVQELVEDTDSGFNRIKMAKTKIDGITERKIVENLDNLHEYINDIQDYIFERLCCYQFDFACESQQGLTQQKFQQMLLQQEIVDLLGYFDRKLQEIRAQYQSLKNPLKVYFVELINYQIRSISTFQNTFFKNMEKEEPLTFDFEQKIEQKINLNVIQIDENWFENVEREQNIVPNQLTINVEKEQQILYEPNAFQNLSGGGNKEQKNALWVNDEQIINYTEMIINDKKIENAFIIDPVKGVNPNLEKIQKQDNFIIIMPLLVSSHWVCTIYQQNKSKIMEDFEIGHSKCYYFNSIQNDGSRSEQAMRMTNEILKKLEIQNVKKFDQHMITANQRDSNSCGYYVMTFIKNIICKNFKFDITQQYIAKLKTLFDMICPDVGTLKKFENLKEYGDKMFQGNQKCNIFIDPYMVRSVVRGNVTWENVLVYQKKFQANPNANIIFCIIVNKKWVAVKILKKEIQYVGNIDGQDKLIIEETNQLINTIKNPKSTVDNLCQNQVEYSVCKCQIEKTVEKDDYYNIFIFLRNESTHNVNINGKPAQNVKKQIEFYDQRLKSALIKCPCCMNGKELFTSITTIYKHFIQNKHPFQQFCKIEILMEGMQQGIFDDQCEKCGYPCCDNPIFGLQTKIEHNKANVCKKLIKEQGKSQTKFDKVKNTQNDFLDPESKSQLSRFCSSQDIDILKLQIEVFMQEASKNDRNLIPAFENMLTKFEMRIKKSPNAENQIDEKASIQKYANEMIVLEGVGKLYKRLEEYYEQKPRQQLPCLDEQKELFKELYPVPPKLNFDAPKELNQKSGTIAGQSNNEQFEDITQDEILKAIRQLVKHKSCGPSGIGPAHLKYIAKHQLAFISYLVKIFNKLLNNPDCISQIPTLYKFRAIFIPKSDGKYRPIAISETALLIFHKLLTFRLRKQTAHNVSRNQFAFARNANVICLSRAEQWRKEGLILTTIDIQNAFNSTSHELIYNKLIKQKVSPLYIKYLQKFLEARKCDLGGNIQCGVPQGDSQSMQLFCIAINDQVEELAKKYKITVYADDILIGHSIEKKPEEIILECVELFKPIGLNVNIAKCKSTYDGGEITFMGQKFKGDSAVSRSERLLATAKKCIEVIDHAPIEAQKKLLLVSVVAVSKVNFGPLIEQSPVDNTVELSNYGRIDEIFVDYIAKLFKIRGLNKGQMNEFCVACKHEGGLELMLPGNYYQVMKAAQRKNLMQQEDYDNLSFESIKEQFMKELRTDQFIEKHKTTPKIGYTLFDYVQINDSTFDYLCQMRFGDKSLYEYKGICAQCGRPQSDHHILVCPYTNNVRTIKHDKVVEGFMKLMDEKKQCKVVCKDNMNMGGERAKPDLEFKFNNKRYLIDVSFVHDKNTMKQRFEGKIQKYINCHKIYGDHQVIPIIIGYDGILYEKTLTLLKGEEFKQEFEEEDRFAALYKIIYREIAKAWHHAENLTYQKTIDDIRKGMYPTNGEEDDDTLGQRSGLLDHGAGTLTQGDRLEHSTQQKEGYE